MPPKPQNSRKNQSSKVIRSSNIKEKHKQKRLDKA